MSRFPHLQPSPGRGVGPVGAPSRSPAPGVLVVAALDVVAKATLLTFLGLVLVDPTWGNLEGKAPFARAVVYPMFAFVVPVIWYLRGQRAPYPWAADLFVTLACFSDILGNRLDLYDSVAWFDDAIHLVIGMLITGAYLLISEHDRRALITVERAVAFGLTAALVWELFEYAAFVTRSAELPTAYADTLTDLALGWAGSLLVALVVVAHRTAARAGPDG